MALNYTHVFAVEETRVGMLVLQQFQLDGGLNYSATYTFPLSTFNLKQTPSLAGKSEGKLHRCFPSPVTWF